MSAKVVLLGCAQDAGLPQMGCGCRQCEYARRNPESKDGLVVCLALVDETEGKVFLIDATPNLREQLWYIQHPKRKGDSGRPLELGGILLTHAHIGHYTGLLQLGKEEADMRGVPVFCTPSMASFLRSNQPWRQLTDRGNIAIQELDMDATDNSEDVVSVQLTRSLSVIPVPVPHRAELSDTVAYVVSVGSRAVDASGSAVSHTSRLDLGPPAEVSSGESDTMKLLYCPDTDGWSGWKRSISSWCNEVDVALLDATFHGKGELKGRDMSEVVSHPIATETMAQLAGCKAEVVLIHLNHTNPLLTADSPERAQAVAAGYKVGSFGMEWAPTLETPADSRA
ncbi:unnamed protein product [Ectocarpus sp. 12 AP-2014]